MSYEIRRVGPRTYDVFTGKQWATWSRVKQGRSSTFVAAGEAMSHSLLKHLHQILAPNMPINYGQSHSTTLTNCFKHI